MNDALQALAYQRRTGVVTIRGRRFQVTEPPPRTASLFLTHLTAHLSQWLVQIVGGQVTTFVDPECPTCGSGKAERISGDRWLCQEPNAEGQPCMASWPREKIKDENGDPLRLTISYALSDVRWRAVLAMELKKTIDGLDPDEAHALAMRMILAGTDYEPVVGQWAPIRDEKTLNMALAQAGIGGMAVMRLAKAHLEVWALPSLVDDWTDTSPASSTAVTPGDSPTPEPERPPTAQSGRVPPRTQRHKG